MKIKQIALFALVLFVLSGCSFISVSYNNADTYFRYTINGYTSFNPEQKNTIKTEVNRYMQWHRKAMLPEYIVFLQQLEQASQSGAMLKIEEATRLRVMLKSLMERTLQPAIRPTASLLSILNAQQLSELERSFADKNQQQREEYLTGSLDEKLKKRAEKTIGYIEDSVGHLSEQQLVNIRGMSYGLPYAAEIFMRFKEAQQARLIDLLNAKSSEGAVAEFLLAWLLALELSRNTNDQRVIWAFEKASDQMIADIYGMLTELQKKTLQKNIAKYIVIFQELAQQQ